MGGCVGGFAKTPTKSTVKKQIVFNKGFYGHTTHQKDWWSSSEMENIHQSRSSQTLFLSVKEKHTNDTSMFVNHALGVWYQKRKEWVGNRSLHRSQRSHKPLISWGATYNDLLTTSRPFADPIPLSEMVDFLVDVWQQEGLYD